MKAIETNVKGIDLVLFENKVYKNVIGRSVYSISYYNNGTFIKDVGNDKEKALSIYQDMIKDLYMNNPSYDEFVEKYGKVMVDKFY